MAGTRLEKLGTIFNRVTSLMKCGAVSPEDKPLWYDIYHAFPPTHEPCYARRVPKTEIKEIFYPEDRIIAKFHRNHYMQLTKRNFEKETTHAVTKKVISKTISIMQIEKIGEDEALVRAVEQFRNEKMNQKGSMFTPKTSRSPLTENVNSLFDQETVKNVSTSEVKSISGKNINVSAILREAGKEQIEILKQNSLVSDYEKALKKASENETNDDPKQS